MVITYEEIRISPNSSAEVMPLMLQGDHQHPPELITMLM